VLVPGLSLHDFRAMLGEESPRDSRVAQRSEVEHQVRRRLDEEGRRVDLRHADVVSVDPGSRLLGRSRDDRTYALFAVAALRDALE
jgi:hypothetical protein